MVEIKNVVILGDSMSDIGNKWLYPTGELARLFRAMRVNETGRYSDGRNWTDFLVEWATGETLMWGDRDLSISKSTNYRTLSAYSVLGVSDPDAPVEPKVPAELDKYLEMLHAEKKPAEPLKEIRYVNYAMGGAIVTNDWSPKFGALTYLRSQVEDYIAQRKMMGTAFGGPTLHVVWIGLNDFVTTTRPDYDPHTVPSVPSTSDYGSWLSWSRKHPEGLSAGVGVFPAVAEIQSLVETVNSSLPETAKDHHFVVIDLPSVYNAIRFMEGLGDPSWIPQAKTIEPVIRRYNEMLESLVGEWPAGDHAPAHVHLVKMSAWMDYVSENMETWDLSKKAQDKGVGVFYRAGLPSHPTTDPVPREMRRRITTSDLAHPTEAVYGLVARYFVTRLLEDGYTLGRLRKDTWQRMAPYAKLPFVPED